MTLALCLVLLGQAKVPPSQTLNLEPSTRPVVEIGLFRQRQAVTVSEYFGEAAGVNEKVLVYRFTYQRPYKAERKRWEKLFDDKSGWTIEEETDLHMTVSRKVSKGKLYEQALILHPGKIVFDRKSPTSTRVIRDPGWVWVAFNELFRR